MVGPSIGEDDRDRFVRRLRIGFALLVGASMALVTLYGDAELPGVALAFGAGTVVGALLGWFVLPDGSEVTRKTRKRR